MSSLAPNPILSMDKILEMQQCFLLAIVIHQAHTSWTVPVKGLSVHFRYPHQPQRRSPTTIRTDGPSIIIDKGFVEVGVIRSGVNEELLVICRCLYVPK